MFDSNQLNKVFRGNDARAYTRVMELRENPEPPPPPPTGSGEPDGERDAFGWRPEPGTVDGEEIGWRSFLTKSSANLGRADVRGKKRPPDRTATPSPPCRPAPARG